MSSLALLYVCRYDSFHVESNSQVILHLAHIRTFLLPQFAARIGNAYSSTNGDLVNTDKGQEMASDEFLNPNDETKNVIKWAEAGLNFTELLDYMPLPPDRRMTDVVNPAFVDMVLSSFEAGNTDPCNSEFKTDDVDLLCQALIDNDISELVENIKHQTVICHSPDDDIGKFIPPHVMHSS